MSIMSQHTSSQHPSRQPLLTCVDHGGNGPALLLLHGVTRCGGDWEPLLPTLTSYWRVFTLDQRGHGSSERAESYLVTDYVADAVSWLRNQFALPITILGHSLGAMVAAAVAAELPQLVVGVVLEDPPFHTMGNRIAGSAWQAQFMGMRDIASRGGTLTEIANALAEIRIPVNGGFKRLGELRDRSSLEWSAACLSQLEPQVLSPIIEGRWLDGYNVTNILSSVCCPTLLLQGDPSCGGALTNMDAETAMTQMNSCRRVLFPGCGHQLHRDRPEELLLVLQDFAMTI
jgi:pimeloyl-ACP methyl ester carboxylesterase